MKRTEKWYQRRLAKYCEEKYGKHEDEIEFLPDPEIHSWLFILPSLERKVLLTCSDEGIVQEVINNG